MVEAQENLNYSSAAGSVATYSEQYLRFKGDLHPQKHSAVSSTLNYQSLTCSAFLKENRRLPDQSKANDSYF